MTGDRTRNLVAAAIGGAVLLLHLLCIPAQGLTDDDDFYATAGIRYARWAGDVLTDPGRALSRPEIDAAFSLNHEHPPFAKLVFGASHALLTDTLGVSGALDGARGGTALFAAVLCAALVLWCWRPLGVFVAVTSPLLLLSLPRFFFHSEVATLDVPVACMVVVVTALFQWAGDSGRRAVVVGVVFGLASLTKLNAPFAALACAFVAVLERWRGFGVEVAAQSLPSSSTSIAPGLPSVRVPWPPWSLLAMALLGPVVFVALWPWLWHDTFARVGAYVAFHLKHYPIYLFFEGEIWERPFAPGRAAVILGFGSMPVIVVALGLVGAVDAARALARIARDATADGSATTARDRTLALAFVQATLALGVVAWSDVPRYGGEKLFMPFFPLFCVLAAQGARSVVDGVVALAPSAQRIVVAVIVVAVATAPGVFGSLRFSGGFALSYYGELVGGLRGAVARGYERTYYDVADKELAALLDEQARGARVHFAPNHKEYVRTYRWLRSDGFLRRDGFVLVDHRAQADVVVLTHERRWSTYPALRAALRDWPVLAEKRIDGVPLWTVLRRRGE